jgi:hypothetical protein
MHEGNAENSNPHDRDQGVRTTPDSPGAPRTSGAMAGARGGRAPWLLASAGLAAGLVAFGLGEATYGIVPAEKVRQVMGGTPVLMPNQKTRIVADAANGAVAFGVLGLCLGGCLGIAGGLARRSSIGAVSGGLLGAILAGALGLGVSWMLLPRFLSLRFAYFDYDLEISGAMHGLIWGLLGAVAGLAFAVGRGEFRLIGRALAAGLAGAVLGTIAYEVIGASFFTMDKTGEPVSESLTTRLMARLFVTVGTAVLVALVLSEPRDADASRQGSGGWRSPAEGDTGQARGL